MSFSLVPSCLGVIFLIVMLSVIFMCCYAEFIFICIVLLSVIFLGVIMLGDVAPITHMHTTFHVGEATTATTTTTATAATTTTTATAGQVQIVKHRSDFFHSNQTFVWVNPTPGASTIKLFHKRTSLPHSGTTDV